LPENDVGEGEYIGRYQRSSPMESCIAWYKRGYQEGGGGKTSEKRNILDGEPGRTGSEDGNVMGPGAEQKDINQKAGGSLSNNISVRGDEYPLKNRAA